MGQGECQREEPKPACRNFETGLAAYLEGEGRPEIPAHASECSACGVILADLQYVIATSAVLEYQDPPARLWANLRVALVSEGLLRSEERRVGREGWGSGGWGAGAGVQTL